MVDYINPDFPFYKVKANDIREARRCELCKKFFEEFYLSEVSSSALCLDCFAKYKKREKELAKNRRKRK